MEFLNLNKLLKIDAMKNSEIKFNLKKMRKSEPKKLLLMLKMNNKKSKKLKLKIKIMLKTLMFSNERLLRKHTHKCL